MPVTWNRPIYLFQGRDLDIVPEAATEGEEKTRSAPCILNQEETFMDNNDDEVNISFICFTYCFI